MSARFWISKLVSENSFFSVDNISAEIATVASLSWHLYAEYPIVDSLGRYSYHTAVAYLTKKATSYVLGRSTCTSPYTTATITVILLVSSCRFCTGFEAGRSRMGPLVLPGLKFEII